MFSWTRTFYAEYKGMCFRFESKRTRDKFIINGAKYISAYDAGKKYGYGKILNIPDRKVPIGSKNYDRS
jgi:hypothetical protein